MSKKELPMWGKGLQKASQRKSGALKVNRGFLGGKWAKGCPKGPDTCRELKEGSWPERTHLWSALNLAPSIQVLCTVFGIGVWEILIHCEVAFISHRGKCVHARTKPPR